MNEKAIFDLVDIYIKQMHERLYRKSEENLLHKPCFLSILSKPDELCFFIKELVNACENTSEIAYIAAGPLEELIHKKHEKIAVCLEKYVRQESKMRIEITMVYASKGSAGRKVLDLILAKFDLVYASA